MYDTRILEVKTGFGLGNSATGLMIYVGRLRVWAVHEFNICDGLGTENHLRMITGLGFRVRIRVEIAYMVVNSENERDW